MKLIYYTRLKSAIALLVLAALFSNTRLLYKQLSGFNYKSIGVDIITSNEKRFEELKKVLPSHGIVGYLAAVYPEKVFVNATAMAGYYAAQYSLAPVVIDNTPNRELVVGNYFPYTDNIKISANKKLKLIKNFNNGLLLFRREIK